MQSQYLSHSLLHTHTQAELGYKLKQGGEWKSVGRKYREDKRHLLKYYIIFYIALTF